jgi:hypothetical protein
MTEVEAAQKKSDEAWDALDAMDQADPLYYAALRLYLDASVKVGDLRLEELRKLREKLLS